MMKASRLSSRRLLQAFCTLLLLVPSTAQTLSAPTSLEGLDEDDRAALETIASREAAVREAALIASQHVDKVVEVQRIQEQSSERFREAVDEQPEDVQEMIWDVVRVPGLLEELGTDGPRTGSELDVIAARQPEALEGAIQTLGRGHYGLIGELLRIDRVAWDRFDALVEDLPDASQQALRDMVDDPELLSILSRRVRLAVHLGDSYRADPEGTQQHLEDLGVEVALRDAAAEEEWRTAMESDPNAEAELERSARLYAETYDYDYDEITDYEVTTVRTVVHHYPYWFGYPSRYANHYLYPYGYWYDYPVHLGFYFGGGGNHHHHHGHHKKVYFGVPSRHYLGWYFDGNHDRHYKHLSHRFSRHHDTHRHARDHRYRTLSYWDKHKGHRNRHGDWHRGDRHPRRHDGWETRRRGDGRSERRFFGDRERRRDRTASRSTRDRDRPRDRRRGDGREADTRSRRDTDETPRTRETRRRNERDPQPTREAKNGRSERERKSSREVETRRSEREGKAERRSERIARESQRTQKRERGSKAFREAKASFSKPKEARRAKRAERRSAAPAKRSEKQARKANQRSERQVRQQNKSSNRHVRKASHKAPRQARAAKASRRAQKVARASRTGGGKKGNGRRR